MKETSQQQQATGQPTEKSQGILPSGEHSAEGSPSAPKKLIEQRKRGVIVTKLGKFFKVRRNRVVVAVVLICLIVGWLLWQIGFPWYIAVLPSILISLVILGYFPSWSKYTGFGSYSKDKGVQPAKTVWDWLQLLLGALLIPVAIAIGTTWFSYQQSQTSMQIANDQQQEAALQTYLDRMSDLLLVDNLGKSKQGDEVRQVARARTLTVLRSLDPTRKGYLLQFLYEANLITKNDVVVDLSYADLSYVNLKFANLSYADLSYVNLKFANLSYADLTEANLHRANLSFAHLSGTILKNADLRFAIFIKAEVTNRQLAETPLLTGTTFPDGSIHY